MRRPGLVAFALTTAVLIPAARHLLDAGPAQVARLAAAGAHTMTLGTTTVTATVDRAMAEPGAEVHVTLAATAPTPGEATVEVVMLEAAGTSGGRVESPPIVRARQRVTLQVAAGGAATPRRLAFALSRRRPESVGMREAFGRFTFLVMKPADAARLEKLRKSSARADPSLEGSPYFDFLEAVRTAGDPPSEPGAASFGAPGTIARLEVATRPLGSPLAVVVPERAQVGAPVKVVVRVRNPARHPVPDLRISLQNAAAELSGLAYAGLPDDAIALRAEHPAVGSAPEDAYASVALAAGETREVEFTLRASRPGVVGLLARGTCEDCGADERAFRLQDAALDALEVVAPEGAPVVTAQVRP